MKTKTTLNLLLGALLLIVLCFASASAEAGRIVRVDHGRIIQYGDNDEILSVKNLPLKDCYFELQDDVILITETQSSWIDGLPAAGTALSLSSGCTVSDPHNGNYSSEKKILIQETDGRIHMCYSDPGASRSALVVSSQRPNEEGVHDARGFFSDAHGSVGATETSIDFDETEFPLGQVGSLELTGELIIHHDAEFDWDNLELIIHHFSVELDMTDITLEVKTKPKSPIPEIPIGHFAIEILPPVLELDLTPHFVTEIEGTGTGSFRYHAEDGFSGVLVGGIFPKDFKPIHSTPKYGFNRATFGGDVFAGISWGAGLEVLEGAAEIACVYQGGINFNGHLSFESEDPGVEWHACKNGECAEGTVRGQFGPLKAELVLVGYPIELFKIIPETFTEPFGWYYYSETFKDGSSSMLCPHRGYRLLVHVRDTGGNGLKGATVSYQPHPDDAFRFKQWASGITDDHGDCRLYIPQSSPSKTAPTEKGNKVTVKVSYPDQQIPGTTLEAQDDVTEKGLNEKTHKPVPENQTFILDTRVVTVRFLDSGSGASNLPATIHLHPGSLNLPDTIPVKSGCHFTGWTTGKDGSGDSYNPGARLDTDHDVDLYAQFKLIWNDYSVTYNANGGTWAPDFQLGAIGKPIRLSDQPAVWEGMKFLGWSFDNDSSHVDYRPGDLFNCPKGQIFITLYAVWKFNPVVAVRIHYDLNGGTSAKAIPDEWIQSGSALQVTETIPEYTGYRFLGWSPDPVAGEASYLPGGSYHFSRDTTLYAVWILTPPLEPVKITYDLNGAPAQAVPDPVWVSPMEWFNITEFRPSWDDHHFFDGWSTNPDAQEGRYFPGRIASFRENTTLYAVWIPSFDISFNLAGGTLDGRTGVITRTVRKGHIITIPSAPTRKGFTFKYWQGSRHYPGDKYRVTGNHTFTAVWEKEVPKTGDPADPVLWVVLTAIGLLGLALVIRRRGRQPKD